MKLMIRGTVGLMAIGWVCVSGGSGQPARPLSQIPPSAQLTPLTGDQASKLDIQHDGDDVIVTATIRLDMAPCLTQQVVEHLDGRTRLYVVTIQNHDQLRRRLRDLPVSWRLTDYDRSTADFEILHTPVTLPNRAIQAITYDPQSDPYRRRSPRP